MQGQVVLDEIAPARLAMRQRDDETAMVAERRHQRLDAPAIDQQQFGLDGLAGLAGAMFDFRHMVAFQGGIDRGADGHRLAPSTFSAASLTRLTRPASVITSRPSAAAATTAASFSSVRPPSSRCARIARRAAAPSSRASSAGLAEGGPVGWQRLLAPGRHQQQAAQALQLVEMMVDHRKAGPDRADTGHQQAQQNRQRQAEPGAEIHRMDRHDNAGGQQQQAEKNKQPGEGLACTAGLPRGRHGLSSR